MTTSRATNLSRVLGQIDSNGPLTRASLAQRTGLTKTTVSKLVADLIDAGLVTENGAVHDGERGRPGVEVAVSPSRYAALGLEINVDYLAACVVDLTRTVRLRRTLPVDNRDADPADVLSALRALADTAIVEGLTIAGAALAVPGTVADAVLHHAPNLGWHDVSLADLPMAVDNEANLAALGELRFGTGATDFLYVSGEIGIGAGLVVKGELFRGAYGFAGELGHVIVAPDGPPCRCGGRGCLELYAGQDALLAQTGASSVDSLAELLAAYDHRALTAVAHAGRALGLALTSSVHLLDPGTIVLGGSFAPLAPWLIAPATEVLAGRLGQMRRTVPALEISQLGADAAVLGAAGQVIDGILTDPGAFIRA